MHTFAWLVTINTFAMQITVYSPKVNVQLCCKFVIGIVKTCPWFINLNCLLSLCVKMCVKCEIMALFAAEVVKGSTYWQKYLNRNMHVRGRWPWAPQPLVTPLLCFQAKVVWCWAKSQKQIIKDVLQTNWRKWVMSIFYGCIYRKIMRQFLINLICAIFFQVLRICKTGSGKLPDEPMHQ